MGFLKKLFGVKPKKVVIKIALLEARGEMVNKPGNVYHAQEMDALKLIRSETFNFDLLEEGSNQEDSVLGAVRIGRKEDGSNDFIISDPIVSRNHGVIKIIQKPKRKVEFFYEALGATNQTTVDEKVVKHHIVPIKGNTSITIRGNGARLALHFSFELI